MLCDVAHAEVTREPYYIYLFRKGKIEEVDVSIFGSVYQDIEIDIFR